MQFTPIRSNAIPRKEKFTLAEVLFKCCARAITASKVLGISATDARNIYHNLFGCKSPSGKTPEHEGWYLQTNSRRIHTSLFLKIYDTVMQCNYDPVRGFIRAYTMYYRDICQERTDLTAERAHLLVRMKRDSEQLGAKGEIHVRQVSKSVYSAATNKTKTGKKIIAKSDEREVDVMVFKSCRKCGIEHVVSKASLSYKCPSCEEADTHRTQ